MAVVIAQDLPPEVLLLSKVKARVNEEARRLPNISCLETVQRKYQPAGGTLRPLDTIRLEVLTNGRKELYAFPGQRNFSEQHPATYSSGGMFGDGLFGLYLKDILTRNTTIQYKGEEEVAGRRLARFDYRLPVIWSGQSIAIPEGSGKVGLRGSYWVDPKSYDVLRLALHADDIPPTLPVAEMAINVNYARTRIGSDMEALLPVSADIRLVKYSGEIKHNVVEFSECSVFRAESTIRFDDPKPSFSNAVPEAAPLRTLPGDLEITIKLRTPISADTAVGTPIVGVVAGNVRSGKSGVILAAGSPVHGHVRRLVRNATPSPHFVVALEFSKVESGGVRYRLFADLAKIGSTSATDTTLPSTGRSDWYGLSDGVAQGSAQREFVLLPSAPGTGEFIVRSGKLNLREGLRTVWQTRPPAP